MIILYHANCNDGSASALAAWLKLGDEGHQYIAVVHGKPPPPEVKGEDVIIVDFCYPRQILLKMGAKSIFVLDHHLSAQKDLEAPFPADSGITYHFDMSKSGAVLSWEYFWPDTPLPRLYQLVQDRDIWTNAFEESAYLGFGLNIFSESFRDWQQLIDQPERLEQAIADGKAIFTFLQQESVKLKASRQWLTIGGHKVPVINAPGFLVSEILHQILIEEPEAPFAAAYQDLPDRGIRAFSMRSDNAREDVSVIAKRYGGGGHRNAAAFSIPLAEAEDI